VNLSAPVVPVSQIDMNYSGRNLYIGMFHPNAGPFWWGNVKKYGLSEQGDILQKDGVTSALDANGVISSSSTSLYQESNNDGYDVNKGGVGEVILKQATRNFYTYNQATASPSTDLTATANAFRKPMQTFSPSSVWQPLPWPRTWWIFSPPGTATIR
jgi:type IV pilus assembly protein PilY1